MAISNLNISELVKVSNEELVALAWTDELTKLYNRRFFSRLFSQLADNCQQTREPLSLILIDVDHFKSINDTHGHLVGDEVLKNMGELLASVAGKEFYPVRYAGDEFLILLPKTNKENAFRLGLELIDKARDYKFSSKQEVKVTLSAGLASFPDDTLNPDELLEKADKALYQSKNEGRNRISPYKKIEAPEIITTPAKLINREKEKGLILEALEELESEGGRVIFLSSPHGFGKSRLLEDALKESKKHNYFSLFAQAEESAFFFPFSAFRESFDRLAKEEESVPPEVKKVAFSLSYLSLQQAEPQTVSHREVLDALLSLANIKPTVVVFDDIQHLDKESRNLILNLLPSLPKMPIFILGAFDIEEAKEKEEITEFVNAAAELGVKILPLTPLTLEQLTFYLEELFPKNLFQKNFIQGIHKASGGSPLLLEELVKLMVKDGIIYFAEGGWRAKEFDPSSISLSFREIVKRRLAGLDRETQEVLAEASSLGLEVDIPLFSKLINKNESELWDSIEKLRREGIVKETRKGEAITLKSDFWREELQDALPENLKSGFHKKMGESFENAFPERVRALAPILLYHFQQAKIEDKIAYYQSLLAAAPTEKPLNEEEKNKAFDFLRSFRAALTNIQLYPEGSSLIEQSIKSAHQALQQLLSSNPQLTFSETEKRLLINGEHVETKGKTFLQSFLDLLISFDIRSLSFSPEVEPEDLKKLATLLAGEKKKIEAELSSLNLKGVVVNEKVYVPLGEAPPLPAEAAKTIPAQAPLIPPLELKKEREGEKVSLTRQSGAVKAPLPMSPEARNLLQEMKKALEDEKLWKVLSARLGSQGLASLANTLNDYRKLSPEETAKSTELMEEISRMTEDKEFLARLLKEIESIKSELQKETPPSEETALPSVKETKVSEKTQVIAEKFGLLLEQVYSRGNKEKAKQAIAKLIEQWEKAEGVKKVELEIALLYSLPTVSRYDQAQFELILNKLIKTKGKESQDFFKEKLIFFIKKGRLETFSHILKSLTGSPWLKEQKLIPDLEELSDLLINDAFARDPEIRKKAIESLKKMPSLPISKLINLYEQTSEPEIIDSIEELFSHIASTNPGLLWEELNPSLSEKTIISLLEVLSKSSQPAEKKIELLINHPGNSVKIQVLKNIARSGEEKYEKLIADFLSSSEPTVALQAIKAAASLKSLRSLPAISELLSNPGTNLLLQKEAALALGKIGDPSSITVLTRIFNERRIFGGHTRPAEVRIACLKSLALFKDPLARNTLNSALQDKDSEVRAAAREILEKLEKEA